MTIAVQVDGKIFGSIEVESDTSEDDASAAAFAIPRVAKYVGERSLKRVIYKPGRIIGIVTGPASPPN